MVELRTSMSISPDCSARKRCWADIGMYLALVASPSTAAATALHRSTSRPDHLPWLSGQREAAQADIDAADQLASLLDGLEGRRRLSRGRRGQEGERAQGRADSQALV